MAPASQSDVEARLGRVLKPAEVTALPGILEESVAIVEGYLGVSYDASEVPDVVRLVVSRIAARALTSPQELAEGAESATLTAMTFSATQRFSSDSSRLWLSKQDKLILRPLHSGFTSHMLRSER